MSRSGGQDPQAGACLLTAAGQKSRFESQAALKAMESAPLTFSAVPEKRCPEHTTRGGRSCLVWAVAQVFKSMEGNDSMSKIAIVYWSDTGNTEAMAQAVAEGVQAQGGEAALFTAGKFDVDMAGAFNAIAFGCLSMGSEELEESEFAPMFAACEPELKDKPIALFGTYGWGDGEWMRTWTDT